MNPEYYSEIDELRFDNAQLREVLCRAVDEHRRAAVLTCPEDCWCWSAEVLVDTEVEPCSK